MIYKILADLVVLLHLAFILFVVFGGLLVFKYNKIAWLHIPVAIYGMLISVFRWICPLTPLENTLRVMAGEQGYEGGFIAHYILPVVYPEGMTGQLAILMAITVLLVNGLLYGLLIRRARKK